MKSPLSLISLLIVAAIACSGAKSVESGSAATAPPPANTESSLITNTPAQEKTCTLDLSAAPAIEGLKLGMTVEEVLALFPGSKDDSELRPNLQLPPSKFGVSGFVVRPPKYDLKGAFAGVSQIALTFLDGRVSSFSVQHNGPEYPHVDQFVEKFLEGTNLPPLEQWQAYVGMENQLKMLSCQEFEISVYAGGEGGKLNYVLVKDLVAEKTLKDRRAKARAQASPTP